MSISELLIMKKQIDDMVGEKVKTINLPDSRIEETDLSNRAKNVLAKRGIKTVVELCKVPPHTIAAWPGIGDGTLKEIIRFINHMDSQK